MDATQGLRDELEKACSLYPTEQERIERAARSAFELDSPLMHKALERALRAIVEARTPSQAMKQIDSMERVLVTSPGFAWLRRMDERTGRPLRRLALAFALLALAAFAVGLVLETLG